MVLLCSLRRRSYSFLQIVVLVLCGLMILVVFIRDDGKSFSTVNAPKSINTAVRPSRSQTKNRIKILPPAVTKITKNKVPSLRPTTTKDPTAFFNIPPVPAKSASDYVVKIAESAVQKYRHYETRQYTEKIVILTPIHNVANLLPNYARFLTLLTYPHHLISIAFGEDCSEDRTISAAWEAAKILRNASFSRVDVFHFDDIDSKDCVTDNNKHKQHLQYTRRKHLAKSRNRLLRQGLKNEDWVLWIDSDISAIPDDIVQQLLSANREIVVPNCLYRDSQNIERVFDKNTWRETPMSLEQQRKLGDSEIMLEGYSPTLRLYLPDLRAEGRVVPIDGVGGCTLLIKADLHRKGLNFPEDLIDHHLETEGLAKLAKRLGYGVFGMPFVNVYH